MKETEAELDGLMARLADGDRSAFARVFERLWGPVYQLCLKLLANDADAADAAQAAMHKIFERTPIDYDRSRPALPWALAIAGFECKTIARKRFRRRETGEPQLERAGEHAEAELERRNLIEAARAALGELSDADRETLLASFWDESASVSGATLRKRRERALERLRKVWKRLYGLD